MLRGIVTIAVPALHSKKAIPLFMPIIVILSLAHSSLKMPSINSLELFILTIILALKI